MPHLRIERRIHLALLALLCLVMAGCLFRASRAPEPDVKRVVYLGIKNAPPALEQSVADRVDPSYARVSAEEYRETARKLNAEGMIDLDVARVAQALDIDVIIHGEYVRKSKRRGQLTVTMRTAAIGAVVAEYVLPVRRGAIVKRSARQFDGELRAELEALLGPPPTPAEQGSAVASTGTADEAAGAPEAAGDEEPGPAAVTPVAAQKPGRAEAAPAAAAPKPGRAEAAPAAAAAKPGRGAKATAQSPRASGEPAKAPPDAAQTRPEPRVPAPVLPQDENGQVIDDEKPPAPK